MSSLRLDVYSSSKILLGNKALDRRRFKGKLGNSKRLKLLLEERLKKEHGVANVGTVASELIKVRNFKNLNFDLLIIVYKFCGEKTFKKELIEENFNESFDEVVKNINERNIFKKNITEANILKFKQDFLLYINLILEINQDLEDPYEEEEEDEEINDSEPLDSVEYGTDNPYNEAEDEYENEMD